MKTLALFSLLMLFGCPPEPKPDPTPVPEATGGAPAPPPEPVPTTACGRAYVHLQADLHCPWADDSFVATCERYEAQGVPALAYNPGCMLTKGSCAEAEACRGK